MEKITNLELGFRDEVKYCIEFMKNNTEYYADIDVNKIEELNEEVVNEIARDLIYDEVLGERINIIIENNIRKRIGVDYL